MSTTPNSAPARYTLRDLPLPAKLVLTTFLISVGMGYLWAMAQIHFKHASAGNALPTIEDLVARFSGVPWPLEPKPLQSDSATASESGPAKAIGIEVDAVKIKTLIDTRCARCHKPGGERAEDPLNTYSGISKFLRGTSEYPKGQFHTVITADNGSRGRRSWSKKNMVQAFFEKSIEASNGENKEWEDLTDSERKELTPHREAERLALVAWVEAGAPEAAYKADAFALPAGDHFKDLPTTLATKAPAPAPGAVNGKSTDKWADAKCRQLSVDALTQSTHAHLLTFAVLWAATGLVFAFTSYPCLVRSVLAPIVLIAQVADVACWWLARLDGIGPYFALAIMGTGAVVGLGLGIQIVLSVWNMYGPKGKAVVVLLFLTGVGLFGWTYVKVIEPQLKAEREFVAKEAK